MEIFVNDVFYVASLSQFTISLTLQSAYILNGAKWVGHPPGKNFYDYFHDFVIVMHLRGGAGQKTILLIFQPSHFIVHLL